MASERPAPEAPTAVASVRALLHRVLRVTLSDGRVVQGRLECFDNLGNFILAHAIQVPREAGVAPVTLGLVLAPGKHVVAVAVREDAGPPADAFAGPPADAFAGLRIDGEVEAVEAAPRVL